MKIQNALGIRLCAGDGSDQTRSRFVASQAMQDCWTEQIVPNSAKTTRYTTVTANAKSWRRSSRKTLNIESQRAQSSIASVGVSALVGIEHQSEKYLWGVGEIDRRSKVCNKILKQVARDP